MLSQTGRPSPSLAFTVWTYHHLHGTLDSRTTGSDLLTTLLLKGEPKMRMYNHTAQFVAAVARVSSY